MSNQNKFYVYVYLDPRKPGKYKYGEYEFEYEPFYVGKGGGRKSRLKYHLTNYCLKNDSNKLKTNKIKKIIENGFEVKIVKVLEEMSEEESYILEKRIIDIIGRKDLKMGVLTNLTNGGEGLTGRFGKENPNFGNSWTENQKKELSLKKKGKFLGNQNPNAKRYKFTNLKTNQEFIVEGSFRNFCKKQNLTYQVMLERLYGITKTYRKFKEWRVEKI